ncbi:hypothetical protein BDV95DRAFT_668048 [Massariosphaeria phaeospora]|uniref:Uncharacterized protein n=1 Tax=Massariosphaeria phaeospora TaxID=100035 RepID=A0A7C8I996_9PLEO|nr:hypothetical protein BDV95DRAFT_668048 [Massariosphaeria phaeospora]
MARFRDFDTQINAAWEVLGDSCKKSEYDRSRPFSGGTAGSRRDGWKPANPQPNGQYSQPSTTTHEEEKFQAESRKKRQDWLDFERIQEQSIRQCRVKVKSLNAEISVLSSKIAENRATLDNDVPYWFNMLSSLSSRMSEDEKNELRRQNLDSEVAIRVKTISLNREQIRLQGLKDDLTRRQAQEDARLRFELQDRERMKRAAKEKADEEAWRRWTEEQQAANEARHKAANEARQKAANEAKHKAADEARRKAANEASERKATEIRERIARHFEESRQNLAKKAKEKADREAAARVEATKRKRTAQTEAAQQSYRADLEAARQKRMIEERASRDAAFKKVQEDIPRRVEKVRAGAESGKPQNHDKARADQDKKESKQREAKGTTCGHKSWWNEVPGPQTCARCSRQMARFGYECPGCQTIACAFCRIALKAGAAPSADPKPTGQRRNTRSSKPKGKARHIPPPPVKDDRNHAPASRSNSPSYDDD